MSEPITVSTSEITEKTISLPIVQSNKRQLEDILQPNHKRFVYFPVVHEGLHNMYMKAKDSFWIPEEIDLTKDMDDWNNKLNDNERHFISMVLAFFAASDGIVMENLAQRFTCEVQYQEARSFYAMQMAIEQIHSHTYSMLIDAYVKDDAQKDRLFNAITNYECIRKKADWAMKWINDHRSCFATRLVAFACVEGIFFSGSFCSIYWLKSQGKMHGLCQSNELISRDEALHTEFAIELYTRHITNKINADRIKEIIKSAVEIEIEFICEALPCNLLGMNKTDMSTYIQFVANRLLVQLGYTKIYRDANTKKFVTNPFPFMERISLESKTNFFERRVTEYSLGGTDDSQEALDSAFASVF
jgi:ribonucleotide reductase beta subunit family protein with ferritin-like domain